MTEKELATALLLPQEAALAYGAISQLQAQLFPEEAVAVQKAVPKRQREFRAGRTAARQTLSQLGLPEQVIPRASDRSPVWPHGIVGSISHSDHSAVAVTARQENMRSLGIDIEPLGGVGRELWQLLFTAAEQVILQEAPAWTPVLFFAIKEAFYKLQHPLTGRMITFLEVELTLDQDSRCTLRLSNDSRPRDSLQAESVEITYAQCAEEIVALCLLPVSTLTGN